MRQSITDDRFVDSKHTALPERCECDDTTVCAKCAAEAEETKAEVDECKPCWCGDPLCIACKRTANAEFYLAELRELRR